LFNYFFDGHLLATVEAEFAVTPSAAEIASGQADEDAGEAGVSGLALQRFIYFRDLHEDIGSLRD
jgi:hypothetical protein